MAIKTLWDRLFGKPQFLKDAEATHERVERDLQQIEATINHETEWFLRCNHAPDGVTCTEVKEK